MSGVRRSERLRQKRELALQIETVVQREAALPRVERHSNSIESNARPSMPIRSGRIQRRRLRRSAQAPANSGGRVSTEELDHIPPTSTLSESLSMVARAVSDNEEAGNLDLAATARHITDTRAVCRLQQELIIFNRDPPENITVEPDEDNIFHWTATIYGPEGTPYEKGIFHLEMDFPYDYPFNPPHVSFLTKIYHCNINSSGHVCVDILSHQWSPVLTVSKILLSIVSLMADPNPKDPLNTDIASLYLSVRTRHDANARSWTSLYASSRTRPGI